MKVWLFDDRIGVVASEEIRTPVIRSSDDRVEADPKVLWSAVSAGLQRVLGTSRRELVELAGISVTSLRQGFVLVGSEGELGPAILNSDRRGSSQLKILESRIGRETLYRITGHWLAPELTLPKLMHIAQEEPDRWAATNTVLFLHDWLVWKLCGARTSEMSFVCAGQLADVGARDWAWEILDALELPRSRFATVCESGQIAGNVNRESALLIGGLLAGTPVVTGGADAQMAAMGLGGLGPGSITVVAGSSTPVQVATSHPVQDPMCRPWVSTHLERGLWAAETNVGYPGTMLGWLRQITSAAGEVKARLPHGGSRVISLIAHPHWTERVWSTRSPSAILGLKETTTAEELVLAGLEAHAFGIRSNVEDLVAVVPEGCKRILLCGGAARSVVAILANVLNRPIEISDENIPAAFAAAALVERAHGNSHGSRCAPVTEVCPTAPFAYEEAYGAYLHAYDHEYQ